MSAVVHSHRIVDKNKYIKKICPRLNELNCTSDNYIAIIQKFLCNILSCGLFYKQLMYVVSYSRSN